MSQASPSKEPSMDEILASIRRIIESSDEKPGAALASSASRIAAADRAAIARETPDRPATFALPSQAARVVPFSDRTATAPEPSAPLSALEEADERWMPLVEPANLAGSPPEALPIESPASEASSMESKAPSFEPKFEPAARGSEAADLAETVEPVVAADRWARELDDAESWSVLDEEEVSAAAEAKFGAGADASASSDVERSLAPGAEPHSAETATSVAEPILADPAESDDDFVVDFDEADFVEALDRNAAAMAPAEDRTEGAAISALAPTSSPEVPLGRPSFHGPDAPVPAARFHPAADGPQPASSVMQQTSKIMSEQAGLQVAAAFDELAHAIRDGQMKSMDDMAREMLRPMLQEWLDDNLPRLVERLVREEIERVSRGGRR